MNQRDMLLRAVLERPFEDTVRLAFADLVDEEGDGGWAGFIRVCVAAKFAENDCHLRPHVHSCWWVVHGLGFDPLVPWLDPSQYVYRRGMVDEVRMPQGEFLHHAPRLFREFPLTRVVLTDRGPDQIDDVPDLGGPFRPMNWRWWWMNSDNPPSQIDEELYLRVRGYYPTRDAAVGALSGACVAWGRELAGLPPLEFPAGTCHRNGPAERSEAP